MLHLTFLKHDSFNLVQIYYLKSKIILEASITEAMMRGREGIKYDLDQIGFSTRMAPILSSNDKISLYFKTGRSNGLLYYNGKTFITLHL